MNFNLQRAQALFLAALEMRDPAACHAMLVRECANDSALLQRVEALLNAYNATGGFDVPPSSPVLAATIDDPSSAQPNSMLAGRYKLIEAIGEGGAVNQALTDKSLHTAHGVIQYELLTGSTPLERQQLKEAAFNEILRLIKEVEPPKPSTRLSSSVRLPSIAAQRNIDPNQLKKSVIGDLDWIVMKAIDKERGRRYETANGLARDVERFLNDEAVEACPPSTTYRLKKMLRRNKGPFLAASLVLLALLMGITGTTYGLFRANHFAKSEGLAKLEAQDKTVLALAAAAAEKTAKEQAQIRLTQIENGNTILTSIFDDLDLFEVKEGTKKLEEILAKRLVKAAEQLDGESVGDPLVVAGLQERLGMTLANLGYSEDAIPLIQKSLATRSRILGADHRSTLVSMFNLASCYLEAMNLDKALPLLEETIHLMKDKLGDDDADTLSCMGNLAGCYLSVGNLDLALPLLEQNLNRQKITLGDDHHDTLASMDFLGNCYHAAGKLNLAMPLLEEVPNKRMIKLGNDHPRTLISMNNLAAGYQSVGKLDLALPLLEETLKLRKIKLGADHPDTLNSIASLAGIYDQVKQWDMAESLFREQLASVKTKSSVDSPAYSSALVVLGLNLLNQKKFTDAEPLLLKGYEGVKHRESTIPPQGSTRIPEALDRLIDLYTQMENPDEVKKWQAERAMYPSVALP